MGLCTILFLRVMTDEGVKENAGKRIDKKNTILGFILYCIII
jgi:hypothetical protein